MFRLIRFHIIPSYLVKIFAFYFEGQRSGATSAIWFHEIMAVSRIAIESYVRLVLCRK